MLSNTSSQNSTVRYTLRENGASHLLTNFAKARSISPKIHSGTPTPRHTCTPSHGTGPGCVPIISTNAPWVTEPLTTRTSLYNTIQIPTLALSKSSLQGPQNSIVSLMASLLQRVRVTGSSLSHAPFGLSGQPPSWGTSSLCEMPCPTVPMASSLSTPQFPEALTHLTYTPSDFPLVPPS